MKEIKTYGDFAEETLSLKYNLFDNVKNYNYSKIDEDIKKLKNITKNYDTVTLLKVDNLIYEIKMFAQMLVDIVKDYNTSNKFNMKKFYIALEKLNKVYKELDKEIE